MSNQSATIEQIIQAVESDFYKIASREKLVAWAEESQFAIQAIYKNDKLQNCDPVSIQNAIINVASVGLTLNPTYGLAYLVPEWNKSSSRNECQLRVSFKGLMKVSVDSGAISFVKAELVKAGDTFEYCGPCEKPIHRMKPFQDRGEITGVYCIAKTAEGDFLTDVMSKAEIDFIKSKAKTQYVWNDWYGEMAKKAIIKRASKQWPSAGSSERFNETVRVVNEHEGNEYEGQLEANQPDPQPLALEHYPQSSFDQMYPQWESMITSGQKTPDQILGFLEKKGATLSQQQIDTVYAIGKA